MNYLNQNKIKMKKISIEEAEVYHQSPVTQMIKAYHNKGEKLPELIYESINFTSGFFLESIVQIGKDSHEINTRETIAQNIINFLPFEMYEQYISLEWLNTYDNSQDLMYSLIKRGKNNVIEKILDLIAAEEKEKNKEDKNFYEEVVFEPLFNLMKNINNISDKEDKNSKIKNYISLFNKGLKVFEPFYKQSCNVLNIKPGNLKKWHKEYYQNFLVAKNTKLDEFNLYLIKNDELLDTIKEIFNQYKNSKGNKLLSKEYLKEAVKNGSEKIVTYYIAELLKSSKMTQEEIEKSIVESLNEKIMEMKTYISNSFNGDYTNDYSNTFKIQEIYEIVNKYGNYVPDYEKLSNLILIDNNDFQVNFVQKILPKEKITMNGLNVNQLNQVGVIVKQIKELTGKGFQKSAKQRRNNYLKQHEVFVEENPYESIYIINQINKLYFPSVTSNETVISDEKFIVEVKGKELDEVYEYVRNEIMVKMLEPDFNIIMNIRLNDKLNNVLIEKGKVKQPKI